MWLMGKNILYNMAIFQIFSLPWTFRHCFSRLGLAPLLEKQALRSTGGKKTWIYRHDINSYFFSGENYNFSIKNSFKCFFIKLKKNKSSLSSKKSNKQHFATFAYFGPLRIQISSRFGLWYYVIRTVSKTMNVCPPPLQYCKNFKNLEKINEK